jgi:predicted transcriptional regulator
MAVLWDQGSATVGEVKERLSEDLAYTTILTVMRSLEAKGHVRHEKEGKAFRYFPLVEAEVAGDRTLSRLLNKVYLGSREMLVTRLLSDKAVSQEELRRIRRMLDERLEEVDE